MDSEGLVYLISILIFLICLSLDYKEKGGLRKGINLIHENEIYEDLDKLFNSYNYSYYLKFAPRLVVPLYLMCLSFFMIAVDLFTIRETWSFMYRSAPFYVGLGSLIYSLVLIYKRLRKKRQFPNGILTIGEEGIWTKKLGDISWLSIKNIIVKVESEGSLQKTLVYYLEIRKFDNNQDRIDMADIQFNRNKLIDLIENYAQQCLEKHRGLSYWQIGYTDIDEEKLTKNN